MTMKELTDDILEACKRIEKQLDRAYEMLKDMEKKI